MAMTSSTLLVAGMHRSGTSLVASAVARMGVDLGREFAPPDSRNRRGYFEDIEFLSLHRKILRACSPLDESGHVDWGWTEGERFEVHRSARFRDEARRLVASRGGRSRWWGWKDPRSTLLLDFWDALLDDARYVLVYRYPWEVADSMQRIGEEVFLRHPEWSIPIWSFYNRRLVDFYRRHADRCVLISANALPEALPRLSSLIGHKLRVDVAEGAGPGPFVPGLFRTGEPSDPIVALTSAASPEAVRLLAELDALADVPTPPGGRASRRKSALRFTEAGHRATAGRPVTVSIVVPCFDDRDFLIDAVASVERNAPDACELVVVNDGASGARTLEILAALRSLGYRVIDQENRGLSAARNTGIRHARGRYLLPLDADNRIRAGFVESATRCLDDHPDVGVAYGDRELFGWRVGYVQVPPFDLERILRSNYVDACAVYRREVWQDCGGYHTELTGLEDWEFWIHAAKRGWSFRHLGEVTFEYRVRPGSLVEYSLQPRILAALLARIHGRHHEVFAAHLPPVLRWFGAIEATLSASPEQPVRTRLARAVNRTYWRTVWRVRSRAWRRARRDLARPASSATERS